MRIYQEMENTERFLDYLLMTGFGEEKVRTLLDKGEVFVLNDNGVIKTVCVVEPLKNGNCQMRAIVTLPDDRRKGYGKDPQKGIKKIPHRREAVGYCLEKFGQFG